jgi:hypothetical protein
VALDFNPERLVNLDQFESLDDAAEYVFELSQDETELERIRSLPLMTDVQLLRVRESEAEVLTLLERVIDSATKGVLLRPRGTSVAQREALLISTLRRNHKLAFIRKSRTRAFLALRRYTSPRIRRFIHKAIRNPI